MLKRETLASNPCKSSYQRHAGHLNVKLKGTNALPLQRRKPRGMPCGCTPPAPSAAMSGQNLAQEQEHMLDAKRLGAELAEAGLFQQAAKAFKIYLERCVDQEAPVLEMYAQVLQELESYDAAREAAGKAVQLQPDWPDAHATYARCCLNCGAVKEALQAFNTARLLMPADPSIASEAEEAADLYSRQLSLLVGLPLRLLSHAPGSVGTARGPGSVVWDSGVLLAWYLKQYLGRPELAGAPVLELGSGTGLVGLAAALCGAQATLTDTHEVVPSLAANVAANAEEIQKAGGAATAAVFDWDSAIGTPAFGEAADLSHGWILGADLVYSHQQVEPLVAALSALRAAHGPSVRMLLAHKHRSDAVDAALMTSLQAAGFHAHEIPP
ncbi:putative methyltransferase-domain-containing protein, partial [Dunaliella salina]